MRVLVHSTGIVRNELKCGYANVVHTLSSFRTHTHTHILIPFEDSEPTGLKVDIAIYTLYLLACQVRVIVGDSGLCCCVSVTSVERLLSPLCVDTVHVCMMHSGPRSVLD